MGHGVNLFTFPALAYSWLVLDILLSIQHWPKIMLSHICVYLLQQEWNFCSKKICNNNNILDWKKPLLMRETKLSPKFWYFVFYCPVAFTVQAVHGTVATRDKKRWWWWWWPYYFKSGNVWREKHFFYILLTELFHYVNCHQHVTSQYSMCFTQHWLIFCMLTKLPM